MKHKRLIIAILILLFILITTTFIFYSLKSKDPQESTSNKDSLVSPTQTPLEMLTIEETIETTIDDTAKNYILKTYPEASELSFQTEIVGRGYGIINASFLLSGNETQRKLYLKESNSSWSVIEESEGQISCETVKSLNDPESMLLSFCK